MDDMILAITTDKDKRISGREIAAAIKNELLNKESPVTAEKDGSKTGLTETLVYASRGKFIAVKVTGPLLNEVDAHYGLSGDGQTAFIESDAASGLALLQPDAYNPMKANSYGTGELILHALDQGCRRFIINLGKSASNDGGAGLLQALGLRFFDRFDFDLAFGGGCLGELYGFDDTRLDPRLKEALFLLACDIDNPLCGPHGTSFAHGSEKGATPEEIRSLDHNLSHFAALIDKDVRHIGDIPGAGAAGGMAAGLMAFLNARIIRGIDLISDAEAKTADNAGAEFTITCDGRPWLK